MPDTGTLKPLFELYVLFMQMAETAIQIDVITLQTDRE